MRRIDSRDILVLAAGYWLIVGVPQTLGRPLPHFENIASAMSFASLRDASHPTASDPNINPYLFVFTP